MNFKTMIHEQLLKDLDPKYSLKFNPLLSTLKNHPIMKSIKEFAFNKFKESPESVNEV